MNTAPIASIASRWRCSTSRFTSPGCVSGYGDYLAGLEMALRMSSSGRCVDLHGQTLE